MSKFNKVLYCNDMLISSSLISEAIKKLECGKSASPDGVYAESIKFAHPRLAYMFYFLLVLVFMFYTWIYAYRYDGNHNSCILIQYVI